MLEVNFPYCFVANIDMFDVGHYFPPFLLRILIILMLDIFFPLFLLLILIYSLWPSTIRGMPRLD